MNQAAETSSNIPGEQRTILGHPRGLVILCFTEMWERFFLLRYARSVDRLFNAAFPLFPMKNRVCSTVAYTALVYVMTIVGGSLADHYLGARKAVTFGAILLTLGHFGMTFEGQGSKQLLHYNESQYQVTHRWTRW